MFNREYHNYDNRTIFPSTIEINEHRAPTDESIKTLQEMESKAREAVIAQIADELPNDFHFNIIVTQLASVEFIPKMILYFRINVNGKLYEHKFVVKRDSSLMHDLMLVGGGRHKTIDYCAATQRFFLLQFSIMIASILFDVNKELMYDLMEMVNKIGATRLNLNDLNLQLEDWEKYKIIA